MKNIVLLLLCFLGVSSVKSQANSDAIKVRAFEATMFSKDLQVNSGWDSTDILIVFGFSNNNLSKLSVYSNKVTKYEVVNFIKTYKDENGISWFIYTGVNDAGEEYTVEWGQFDNFKQKQIGTLRLYNEKGLGFIYKLKLN